jgi:hypothetical protein
MAATQPIARIIDASAYLRPARGGLMMGGMDVLDLPGPLVPALGDTPVAEHRGGLFTMTPDAQLPGRPGPRCARAVDSDRLQRQWLFALCRIGRSLAEWIVGGEPPLRTRSIR